MKASVSWSHHCMLSRTSSSGRSDGEQRPAEPFEEAVALPGIRHGPGAGRAPPWPSAGISLLDFGTPGGVEGRRRRLDRIVAQPLRHRGQRQPSRGPEALATRDHRALLPCRLSDLGDQAGLPHAGATADQHETAAPA